MIAPITLASQSAQSLPSAQATLSRLQLTERNLVAAPSRSVLPSRPQESATPENPTKQSEPDATTGISSASEPSSVSAAETGKLDARQVEQILELAARDREVRLHEQAHLAAGGQYAGAVHYSLVRGPDGRTYAVGGEVDIDVTPVAGDPAATIHKMEQIQRAALAPAEPSAQDRAVAALAAQQILQAQAEQARQLETGDKSPADRAEKPMDVENTETSTIGMAKPDQTEVTVGSMSSPTGVDRSLVQDTADQGVADRAGTKAVEAYQELLALSDHPQIVSRRSSQLHVVI